MICLIAFYYIEKTGGELTVNLDDLGLGSMPLIWYNAGLYGVLSKEKVENMRDVLTDQDNLPVLDKKPLIGVFHWDEVKKLDSKIGKLLTA